jgi:hypothetical protein
MKLTKAMKDLLASVNIKPEDLAQSIPTEENQATVERDEYEAQSLLTCLEWPYKEMKSKRCKRCKAQFLTSYTYFVYCSNACTEAALKEHFGLWWRPKESYQEQWGAMQPPLSIGPRQIQAMRDLLSLLDQENSDQTDNQEQDFEAYLFEDEPYDASHDPLTPDTDYEIQSEPDPDEDSDFLLLLESFPDE